MTELREIDAAEITRVVRDLCIEINYKVPEEMVRLVKRARELEESPLVGLVALGAIINAFDGESSSGDGDAPSSSVVVTYVVSGDSNQADVTYQNRNGDTSQESAVSLPWESGFATTSGAFVREQPWRRLTTR
jgi:hypothetical protein